MKYICHMCAMPLAMSTQRIEKEHYCSFCFSEGEFVYIGNDVKEFKKITYRALRAKGTKRTTAWLFIFMIGFAPHWKREKFKAIER